MLNQVLNCDPVVPIQFTIQAATARLNLPQESTSPYPTASIPSFPLPTTCRWYISRQSAAAYRFLVRLPAVDTAQQQRTGMQPHLVPCCCPNHACSISGLVMVQYTKLHALHQTTRHYRPSTKNHSIASMAVPVHLPPHPHVRCHTHMIPKHPRESGVRKGTVAHGRPACPVRGRVPMGRTSLMSLLRMKSAQ